MKFIFVTGGVVSGLGKGIVAASLGALLKERSLKVSIQKLDPYMNIDPGTMSPFQHGEVFVTDDGAETDLDLGHYERFIDESLTRSSNLTSGAVYWNVLQKERSGAFLGQTVQIIPHVTNEIKLAIYNCSNGERGGDGKSGTVDVAIVEIGGTTGDIEQQAFLEAARQIATESGRGNCLFIHVCLVPFIPGSLEYKSKPTQHSVRELQSCGIAPGVIIARCDGELSADVKEKIALFCNVPKDCVITNKTLGCLYEVPLMLSDEGLPDVVCRELSLPYKSVEHSAWRDLAQKIHNCNKSVTIALVGKYVKLHDSYLSVVEALNHASFALGAVLTIKWVDSDSVTAESSHAIFSDVSAVILPGGFGTRGVEGMIATAKYCRENNLPYFGICLGMQIAVIEFARSVLGYSDGNSSEFDATTKHAVIDLLPGQEGAQKGGTMRLGSYPCVLKNNTILADSYSENVGGRFDTILLTQNHSTTDEESGEGVINERHRHRYEFNNAFRDDFTKNGLVLSGTSPDGSLVEAVELDRHKHVHYIGVQFHPEFKSRPLRPHGLFISFIRAALK